MWGLTRADGHHSNITTGPLGSFPFVLIQLFQTLIEILKVAL